MATLFSQTVKAGRFEVALVKDESNTGVAVFADGGTDIVTLKTGAVQMTSGVICTGSGIAGGFSARQTWTVRVKDGSLKVVYDFRNLMLLQVVGVLADVSGNSIQMNKTGGAALWCERCWLASNANANVGADAWTFPSHVWKGEIYLGAGQYVIQQTAGGPFSASSYGIFSKLLFDPASEAALPIASGQ